MLSIVSIKYTIFPLAYCSFMDTLCVHYIRILSTNTTFVLWETCHMGSTVFQVEILDISHLSHHSKERACVCVCVSNMRCLSCVQVHKLPARHLVFLPGRFLSGFNNGGFAHKIDKFRSFFVFNPTANKSPPQ